MSIRKPFSINLEADLIAQYDELAEVRQESRSAVIERVLRNGLEDERRFLRVMGSPVTGQLIEKILTSPKLAEMIGRVVQEEVSPEQLAEARQKAPKLREAAKKRRSRSTNPSTSSKPPKETNDGDA